LSLDNFAKKANLTEKTVKKLLDGKPVDKNTIQTICNALNIEIEDVVNPKTCRKRLLLSQI
jgi:DNA-binding Xre family transcriptional regulator